MGHPHSGLLPPKLSLWSDAAVVTVRAVDSREIAKVDRMLEGDPGSGGHERLRAFLLREHGVAGIAIFADGLACLAQMVAVVTAEAAREIKMPDIVGMRAPVDFHLRKDGGAENT